MSVTRQDLQKLYLELDKEMREGFDRSLPLDEYLLDRFDRAKVLEAGEGASLHHLSYVYGKVKIGAKTWVGPMTLLDGSGGLEIGENCSISSGVHIYSHDTMQKRLTGGKAGPDREPVKIGHSCYIGAQSVIAKGVELGNYCVVGANSFVQKSFPDGSVIMGTPARLRGNVRFDASGVPSIEWLPKVDLEQTVERLHALVLELEGRIRVLEKVRH